MAHRLTCSVEYGIFLDQGSDLGLLHMQVDYLLLSHRGSAPFLIQGAAWCGVLCLQAGTESGHGPGWSEADQWPALLLLKPEQDLPHFSFPNTGFTSILSLFLCMVLGSVLISFFYM